METSNSPEFATRMKGQDAFARETLGRIPGRQQMLKRVEELSNAQASVSRVVQVNEDYFFLKLAVGEQTPKLYVRHGGLGGERLLLNPDTLGLNGTHHAIDYLAPSWDGRYVACGVSEAGSRQSTLYVVESANGHDTDVKILRARYPAVAWRDAASFFYYREHELGPIDPQTAKEPDGGIYLHLLGGEPTGKSDAAIVGLGIASKVTVTASELALIYTTPASRSALFFVGPGLAVNGNLAIPHSNRRNEGDPFQGGPMIHVHPI